MLDPQQPVIVRPEDSTGGSVEEQQQEKSTSLLSLQLTRNKTKKVMINWFSEGDSGSRLSYELEITDSNLVSDIIGFSTLYFEEKTNNKMSAQDYVLRPAKKDGKPKTEYPVLDNAQAVYSSGFLSFTLCPASLKAKDAWVPAAMREEDEKESVETLESKESRDFVRRKSEDQRKDLPPPPAGQSCCACVCF